MENNRTPAERSEQNVRSLRLTAMFTLLVHLVQFSSEAKHPTKCYVMPAGMAVGWVHFPFALLLHNKVGAVVYPKYDSRRSIELLVHLSRV